MDKEVLNAMKLVNFLPTFPNTQTKVPLKIIDNLQ